MNKLTKIVAKFGYIDVFTNKESSIIYAIPNGYVGPTLVKKDLEFLANFDSNCKGKWTYIVDTSKVKVVNPINPFLLKGLKQFSKMEAYVVYAPSPIVRGMLKPRCLKSSANTNIPIPAKSQKQRYKKIASSFSILRVFDASATTGV